MHKFDKAMDKLTDYIEKFLIIFLIIMTLLTFVNVICRYVFLKSLNFAEEITVTGMVMIAYAGAACAAKDGSNITLSIVYDMMPDKVRKVFDIIGDVIGLLFSAVIVHRGILMVITEIQVNQRSTTMGWPQWIFGSWLPIGGLLMLMVYLYMIPVHIRQLVKLREGKGE